MPWRARDKPALGNSGLSLSFMASRESGRLPAPQFPYLRCENGNAYGWGVYSKAKMCVKPLTWDTRAPQMGGDLRVPITVTAIVLKVLVKAGEYSKPKDVVGASLVAQLVKHPPVVRETWLRSWG